MSIVPSPSVGPGASGAYGQSRPLRAPPGLTARRVVLSLAVAGMGVIDLLSALLSRPPERLLALRHLVPTEILDTSRTFTLLAGALLLVTAWGLRRGKRRAFVMAMALCAVSVPVNLLKAFDVEEATAATALMFALGVSGDAFRVKSRALSGTLLRSGVLLSALALLLYALAGLWLIDMLYGVRPELVPAFRDAAYRLLGIGDPVRLLPPSVLPLGQRHVVTWFLGSLPVLTLVWVISVAIALLRPTAHRRRHRHEADLVAELIARYGESSVSWFALDEDADYFFSRNRRAVIAYRFESGVLLAIGDPIGPREEFRPLLEDFEMHCREHDWQFAFFQARPECLELYREMGWRALHIGEDPVLWTESFTLAGTAMSQVRRQARRAEQAGIVVRHFEPGLTPLSSESAPAGWIEQLRVISNEWLRSRYGGEKGFCMGRFDPHRLDDVWVSIAVHEATGRIEAFSTWVPIPQRRGWALDLTRRRGDAPVGTMELLVVRSIETARARGAAMLSLALSALAKVDVVPGGEPETEPTVDRARAFLMEHLARFYEFKGLFQWKKKFQPAFEDRYLVYPRPLILPSVAIALVRAQSSGGLSSYVRGWFAPRSERPFTAGETDTPRPPAPIAVPRTHAPEAPSAPTAAAGVLPRR